MLRKFIFKAGRAQLTLPVTPEGFSIGRGRRAETVAVHEVGDVVLPGGSLTDPIKLSCLLPARRYPFGGADRDPYEYVDAFLQWMEQKRPVRFVVTGTTVNLKVFIGHIQYGESDGTNDVTAEITLQKYPELSAAEVAQTGANRPAADETTPEIKEYAAKKGDTLCGICRQFYGDGSYALAQKLAARNGRPNPNILYVGEILKIPGRQEMGLNS